MSARQAGGGEGGGARSGLTVLLLVVVAVGMMMLLRAEPATDPFDPRSGAASGTRGLVILLEHQGADVDVVESVPAPGSDRRVLVLQDRLNDEQRMELRAFADAGGVVVMADPASELLDELVPIQDVGDGALPLARDLDTEINLPLGACDVPALGDMRGLFVRHGVLFAADSGDRWCFAATGMGTGDPSAFVLARPQGDGIVVQLGDNELFTNRLLRYADNGPLATALLAPTDESRVSILIGSGAAASSGTISSEGDDTLADLVRPGVWMAIAQLAIAFVVFATARAIRPGRPVREPQQVPIAGNELVVATGTLMYRAQHAERAGSLLRFSAHRALCEQFHLPVTTTVAALDAAVAARTTVPAGRVVAVLARDVRDAADLLALSNDLHTISSQTGLEQPGNQGANQ
ncbi:MAG: DUF4350 domain-containing protein [Actinomycetota bacterium]|nr:DUF4350 domain-containing protein [Actinomycetota bacterium]